MNVSLWASLPGAKEADCPLRAASNAKNLIFPWVNCIFFPRFDRDLTPTHDTVKIPDLVLFLFFKTVQASFPAHAPAGIHQQGADPQNYCRAVRRSLFSLIASSAFPL
jgi:hypothetical protein